MIKGDFEANNYFRSSPEYIAQTTARDKSFNPRALTGAAVNIQEVCSVLHVYYDHAPGATPVIIIAIK